MFLEGMQFESTQDKVMALAVYALIGYAVWRFILK